MKKTNSKCEVCVAYNIKLQKHLVTKKIQKHHSKPNNKTYIIKVSLISTTLFQPLTHTSITHK